MGFPARPRRVDPVDRGRAAVLKYCASGRCADVSEEEDIIYWQDVLDEIAAGRRTGLVCPFCKKGQLAIEDRQGGGMQVSCPQCKKFIEGSLGPDY